jgi:serine/threonine protein kinase
LNTNELEALYATGRGRMQKPQQNICAFLGVVFAGENMYLMTEYVHGTTLYSFIRESGRLSEPIAAKVMKSFFSWVGEFNLQ